MLAEPEPESAVGDVDVRRRTWLAAERTWLAWWRTGLGTIAISVGVGRLLPGLSTGARWPLQVLGLGYCVLAIVVLAIGARRERDIDAALRRGGYEALSPSLVNWLTVAGIALGVATLVVITVAI